MEKHSDAAFVGQNSKKSTAIIAVASTPHFDFALNIHDLSVWFPGIRVDVVSSTVEGECRVNIAGSADLTVVGEVGIFDCEEMGKEVVSFDEFERYRWGGEDLDAEFYAAQWRIQPAGVGVAPLAA